MSWFLDRVWPSCRTTAVALAAIGTVIEPAGIAWATRDSDGQVVAVRWDFGDGTTSLERNPTHLYAVPGKFVVTLTATDDSGASAAKTGKVEVRAK